MKPSVDRSPQGGWALLVVLLVTALLALVGTSALLVAGNDDAAAGARDARALALLAAEAGLVHWAQQAPPTIVPDQTAGSAAGGYVDLLAGKPPFAGPTEIAIPGMPHRFRYRVWGGPPWGVGSSYVIEGEVLDPETGHAIAAARLSTAIAIEGGETSYGGVSGGPRGSGVVGAEGPHSWQGL